MLDDVHKLKPERYRLDIRKIFLPRRTIQILPRYPREMVSPSVEVLGLTG